MIAKPFLVEKSSEIAEFAVGLYRLIPRPTRRKEKKAVKKLLERLRMKRPNAIMAKPTAMALLLPILSETAPPYNEGTIPRGRAAVIMPSCRGVSFSSVAMCGKRGPPPINTIEKILYDVQTTNA